jgi:hypothetical protein
LKDPAAWMAEKISQLKLRRDHPGGLGTFEALEALALGISGKLELWTALRMLAEANPLVPARDYEQLAARARDQHRRVEECRLRLARTALRVTTWAARLRSQVWIVHPLQRLDSLRSRHLLV